MIIVPELKSVFITPPRTASTSLRHYLPKSFPKAIVLNCHGEYSEIPACFADYQVVGVVRDPLERLNSLYNFIRSADPTRFVKGYFDKVHNEAKCLSFMGWLLDNNVPFTQPMVDSVYYPKYNVRNIIPEVQKTYHMYFGNNAKYIMFDQIADQLGLYIPVTNSTLENTLSWNEVLDLAAVADSGKIDIFDTLVKRYSECYRIFKETKANSNAVL